MEWAVLLRRTFGFDALRCPKCDAKMRVLSTINAPDVAKKILSHLGMRTESPSALPVGWAEECLHLAPSASFAARAPCFGRHWAADVRPDVRRRSLVLPQFGYDVLRSWYPYTADKGKLLQKIIRWVWGSPLGRLLG